MRFGLDTYALNKVGNTLDERYKRSLGRELITFLIKIFLVNLK